MPTTIEDLQPKPFTIKVKGLELECKPLRMSHALIISKVGEVFQSPKEATLQTVNQAEQDMDAVIGELIPELKGVQLDMATVLEVITQMMEHIQPSDNKELDEKGVKFDTDPKAQVTG